MYELIVSFFVVLVFLVVTGSQLPVIPARDELPWVLILGLVNTGLAYYLYFSAMQQLPGQTVALLCYIDPLTALLLSAVFLHEHLLPLQIAGAVLILGGACLGADAAAAAGGPNLNDQEGPPIEPTHLQFFLDST